MDASTATEFDVEATDTTGEEVNVRPAPPVEPPQAAPSEAVDEKKNRGGRPRKVAAIPTSAPANGVSPASTASTASEPWPRDARDMWIRFLKEAVEEGRTADEFVMYVYRMMGPTLQPMRMPVPIYGSQVAGDQDNGINPGDALIDWLTDYYHMSMTTTAASYRVEFCWRSSGLKIRMSEPWALDTPSNIDKLRRRIEVAQSGTSYQAPFVSGYGAPPRRAYAPPPPPPPHPYPDAQPPAAAAPAPVPASTGDAYLDRLLALQEERSRIEREDSRRREEEAKAQAAQREAEMKAQLDELRLQLQHAVAPPPPAAPAAPASPVESQEVRDAKLAATISQALMQTLIATGVVKPGQPAAPTTGEAQQAAQTVRQGTNTLEAIIDDIERNRKLEKRVKTLFGVPEEEEQEEEEEKEEKEETIKASKLFGTNIRFPKYDKDDDPGNLQKFLNWMTANPEITKEVATTGLNMLLSKIDPTQITGLLGALMGKGGMPALAAGAVQSAMGSGGGGGFTPPTA